MKTMILKTIVLNENDSYENDLFGMKTTNKAYLIEQ